MRLMLDESGSRIAKHGVDPKFLHANIRNHFDTSRISGAVLESMPA